MSHRHAVELIETLTSGGFQAECVECGECFGLRRAGLFYSDDFTAAARELYDQALADLAQERREIKALPRQIIEQSDAGARAVNVGCILERLAPFLGSFPFHPSECRSVFDPVDYVAFRGLARSSTVEEIAFVEIKTGKSRLNARQQSIRTAVEAGEVTLETYHREERA